MKKMLLYTAVLLTTLTFMGHTAGVFAEPSADDVQLIQAYSTMKLTPFPLPMGAEKTLMQVHLGADISLSLFLLVSAALLISQIRREDKTVLRITSVGLAGISVISFFCFFPLPAIFCGIASLCGATTSFMT